MRTFHAVLTSTSVLYRMTYGNTSTMDVQNVYKCVYVGVNPALAPVSRFTPLSTTQGHEGPRAQGLSSGQRFPKPQSPLGECKGNRAGSVLMGFADVCCWRRSPKASSFVCLGCATNNVNWKKLTFWTFYSEVMCGLSAVDNLMFNVLFHLMRHLFRRLDAWFLRETLLKSSISR